MAEGGETGGHRHVKGPKSASTVDRSGGRLRFTVELNPEETTTIVSWTKLLREADLSDSNLPESSIGPSFEAQAIKQTKSDPKDSQVQAGSNCLSTVIEGMHVTAATQGKEGPSIGPNTTTLEEAIAELENMVAELRPSSTEAQDPKNVSLAVKRRLPPEIKLKLAEISGIAQARYDEVPKDMINHLMSIVGHLTSTRTLKRNHKAIAKMGLSAKQEKGDRMQKIKHEVAEMVKLRILYTTSKEVGPKEKEDLISKSIMDDVLENKICDLYDLYVERLEEGSGSPVESLFQELVSLWSSGIMNPDGIERAIDRAKHRKSLCSHQKDQEKVEREMMLAPEAEDAAKGTQEPHDNVKLSSVSHVHGSSSTKKHNKSAAAGHVAAHPSIASANQEKSKKDKMKWSSSSCPIDVDVLPIEKAKRKPNPEIAEAWLCLEQLAVSSEKRPKQNQHS